MNIILILIDSLNRDCLSIHNPQTECRTPNIERLARKGHVFDNHFVGSLPCMPVRREIFSGRKEFMWRPWGSLEVFDPRLPQIVGSAGYNTAIVTDHYHYWEEEANGYIQGFKSSEMIRGHEIDHWKVPENVPDPQWVQNVAKFGSADRIRQYAANVKDFNGEGDYFPAKVFSAAGDWLRENARKAPFFLQVENFDVHEPFDVPEPYASMYTDRSRDEFNIWPPYQVYDDLHKFMKQTSPEELEFIRSQYMGKVTMMDAWLGKFMQALDELSLWDDTVIILTTDHGHDLGQRGAFGKQYPHYDSHANIPMIMWHPHHPGGGDRIKDLTQTVDLFATIVTLSGQPIPAETRQSKSLLPIVENGAPGSRDAVLYGTFGQGICVTDGEWTLFRSPVEGKPLFSYSTMIARPLIVDNPVDGRVGRPPEKPVDQGEFDSSIDFPLWKIPIKIDPRTDRNFLFNRVADPDQRDDLWEEEPEQRERMLKLARILVEDEGCPPEQLERLGIPDAALGM